VKISRRGILISSASLALAAAGASQFYDSTGALPFDIIELNPGKFLRTYLVSLPNIANDDRVEVTIILQKGEADMSGPEGMLHYVEHLAWYSAIGPTRGTSKADTNAWTNSTAVAYWLAGTKSEIGKNLETLLRIFEPLSVPQEFALQERDIVQREYDLGVANNPNEKINQAINRFLYAGHGLARSTIGASADIVNFDLQKALAMHAETHKIENAILVFSGNVSQQAIEGYWPDSYPEITGDLSPMVFKTVQPGEEVFKFPDVALAPKVVWRRLVTLKEPVDFELLVMQCAVLQETLLSNVPGGLAKPLRFDKFIARSFELAVIAHDESHVELQFTGAPDKNIGLSELHQSLLTALANIAREGIPQTTFNRILWRIEKDWPSSDDASLDRLKQYAIDRAAARRALLSRSALQDIKLGVNATGIDELVRQIDAGGRTAVAFIGQEQT
jgi:hypothetical protein